MELEQMGGSVELGQPGAAAHEQALAGAAGEAGPVGKIRASVDGEAGAAEPGGMRALEERLARVEQRLAALEAASAPKEMSASAGRKTLSPATVQLLAKQGIDAAETVDVQSLDAALAGLSVEQRIAVKAQMLRNGTLTR